MPCSVDSIDEAIKFWRGHELLRVARWQRNHGLPTAYYTFGSAPDAEIPPPRTSAEQSRIWRGKGGDSHRARTMARQQTKIAKGTTLAGLLQINHRRTTSTTQKGAAGRGKTTAPVTQ